MNQSIPEALITASRPVRCAATVALSVLALFLLVEAYHVAFGHNQGDPYNTITVTGEGDEAAVPDVAQITYTVTESASTVTAAQDSATKKGDAALDAVKQLGIADKDIKTVSYTVSPKYDYNVVSPCAPGGLCSTVVHGSPTIVGYEVSQSIELKIRDTAKAGDVLAALGTLGVQNISGPNFMVDDPDGINAKAREEAIADARAKAKVLAGQLGVHLGKVVSFSENGNYPMPMYASYSKAAGASMDMAAAPSLPVGESETKTSVSVTYEIR